MDVILETAEGWHFPIELWFSDTVLEIKKKVQEFAGYPVSTQKLVFQGQELADDGDIERYGILNGSRIQLFIAKPDPVFFAEPDSGLPREAEDPVPFITEPDSGLPEIDPALFVAERDPTLFINEPDSGLPEIDPALFIAEPDPALFITKPDSGLPTMAEYPVRIRIIIKISVSGQQFSLEANPTDTVGWLKQRIRERIPMDRLLLFYGNVELHDQYTLADYGITDNSEVNVITRPLPSALPSTSRPKKLKLIVQSMCGTRKIQVEVNPSDNVTELRKDLDRLHGPLNFPLPSEGYFFIHKQAVMDEDQSFRWHRVRQGDTVEVFRGWVTSGS